ncbi:MAG: hypothetical protein R3279_12250 [Putridiphycobacter sp.]|nr:hypothetical protein [Putridiphycobacter sp.]
MLEDLNQPHILKTISSQLKKILESKTFSDSVNLKKFLKYIVNESLEGRAKNLKQYTIAVQAFGRDYKFDPQTDPIVRIQAGRLRQLLSNYYNEEGLKDSVIIGIPKGSYIPEFSLVEKMSDKEGNKVQDLIPDLYVFPFKNLSINKDRQFILDGFTEELICNLSYFKNINTIRISSTDGLKDLIQKPDRKQSISKFYVSGSIRFTDTKIKVIIGLYNIPENIVLTSLEFNETYTLDNIISLQERISNEIATCIADVYGGAIIKRIQWELNENRYIDIGCFEMLMRFYAYLRNPTHFEYAKILEFAYESVKKYPNSGPSWGVLAEILINNYILGYTPNCPKLLEESSIYIKKAIALSPNSQMIRTVYGIICLIHNQIDESIDQFNYAKSLNPKSAFYIGVIGFYSSFAGNWQEGMEDLQMSFKLNPDYPKWYHVATTLFLLKEKKYEKALKESYKINLPEIFWDPLLKSVCFVYNDNLDEAEIQLDNLRHAQPDFFNKPLFYLKHFIKFDALLRIVLDGLVAAGLEEQVLRK